MLLTVEGTYTDGKVELAETPTGVKRAKVLVTFLPSKAGASRRFMIYGQFAGERMSTEEDFRLAEWRSETDEPDGN